MLITWDWLHGISEGWQRVHSAFMKILNRSSGRNAHGSMQGLRLSHGRARRRGCLFWYMFLDVTEEFTEASIMSRDTSLAYSMLLSALETLCCVINGRSLVPTLCLLWLCSICSIFTGKIWYFRIKTKCI